MMSTRVRHSPQFIEQLRGTTLFRGCTDRELARADELGSQVDVEAGRVLCRQGRVGSETFVIVAGEAAVSIGGVEVARIGPGGFFGEMSLLDGAPRTATVTALTPMMVIVFAPHELNSLLENPRIARQMLATLTVRLRRANAGIRPR
jgi:CRP-like cAMP-binding protein